MHDAPAVAKGLWRGPSPTGGMFFDRPVAETIASAARVSQERIDLPTTVSADAQELVCDHDTQSGLQQGNEYMIISNDTEDINSNRLVRSSEDLPPHNSPAANSSTQVPVPTDARPMSAVVAKMIRILSLPAAQRSDPIRSFIHDFIGAMHQMVFARDQSYDSVLESRMPLGRARVGISIEDVLCLLYEPGADLEEAWLTDSIMQVLIDNEDVPANVHFEPPAPLQMWLSGPGKTQAQALQNMNANLESARLGQLSFTDLPMTDISPDATSAIFLHNVGAHWLVGEIEVGNDPKVCVYDPLGNGEAYLQEYSTLARLVSYHNTRFAASDWNGAVALAKPCPQQSDDAVDCGVWCVYTLLRQMHRAPLMPDLGNNAARHHLGSWLRERFALRLQNLLDVVLGIPTAQRSLCQLMSTNMPTLATLQSLINPPRVNLPAIPSFFEEHAPYKQFFYAKCSRTPNILFIHRNSARVTKGPWLNPSEQLRIEIPYWFQGCQPLFTDQRDLTDVSVLSATQIPSSVIPLDRSQAHLTPRRSEGRCVLFCTYVSDFVRSVKDPIVIGIGLDSFFCQVSLIQRWLRTQPPFLYMIFVPRLREALRSRSGIIWQKAGKYGSVAAFQSADILRAVQDPQHASTELRALLDTWQIIQSSKDYSSGRDAPTAVHRADFLRTRM